MAPNTTAIRTVADVLRRVVILTVISIVFSFVITSVGTFLYFGVDLQKTLQIFEVWRFSLSVAIGVPMLVCPIVTWQATMTLRDLYQARAELEHVSCADQLTGLLNRRGFDLVANRTITKARTAKQPVSVLMCDIDFFKSINDRFGHDRGDSVLQHVAEVLRGVAEKRNGILGRQGGDEFVVLLPGFALEEAAALAENLRAACASLPIILNAQMTRVTMSIGLASAAQGDSELSTLMSLADGALYQAKRNGRNQVAAVKTAPAVAKAA
jgi:diguanylate cyclase (GGDEF)-like protein